MPRQFFAWGRVAFVAALFGLASGVVLWSWHARPPVAGLSGSAINGRNVPGDLSTVLGMLGVEFLVALVALQPWTPRPRRRWVGGAGLVFGAWGVLRILVGLHSPPVMLPHDLLMLVLGLTFSGAVLVFPREREGESLPTAT
jgi:hypothetical protein